jgi:hypothetical protein
MHTLIAFASSPAFRDRYTMNDECPHCGEKLIEKHDEIVEERSKTKSFTIVVLVVGSGQRRGWKRLRFEMGWDFSQETRSVFYRSISILSTVKLHTFLRSC